MATAAHAVPTVEVSTADDMDLHSDNGIDFGDGDIELDFEPTPGVTRPDDDVSIHDAASVTGQEAQTVPTEQDDYMADHEDLIEEDFDYQEDDGGVATEQFSMTDATVPQKQTIAPVDEDLIDYSDDEDQDPRMDEAVSLEEGDVEVLDIEVEHEESTTQQVENRNTSATSDTASGPVSQRNDHSHSPNVSEHGTTPHEADDQVHSPYDQLVESRHHNEDDQHVESDDGGVLLHDPEGHAESDESALGDLGDEGHDEHDHEDASKDYNHGEHSSKLQPVTVNYAGNELWLFKEHDPDDSGDWLLDDMALAKATMSELFQACRSSLGDDVSHEHEIGFRFDHLHNLELYEDNTACVAVSLERLVELYHTLQTQDGNNEPESFYISLLFRPRFATLLSDVAKYAEQGSGYAALNAAVAAGDTHFTNVFSGASTDEPTEWGNDESDEADEDDESNKESADDEVEQEEHQGHSEAQVDASEDGRSQHDLDNDDEAGLQAFSQHNQDPTTGDTASPLQSANIDLAHLEHQQAEPENGEAIVETDAQREQREADLIDYGDEEAADDIGEAEDAPATMPLPSPSTIQGDDFSGPRDAELTAEFVDEGHQQDEHHDDFDFDAEDVHEDQSKHQQTHDDDDATQSYQDYVQDFEDEDPFQGLQADGAEDYAADAQYDGDANQDFAGLEYPDLDQQPQADFMNGPEFNEVDDLTATADDFTETSDFLDLDNAPEWVTDQEPASNLPDDAILVRDDIDASQDKEDGVAEQPALAVSSAADNAAVSSKDLKTTSPQGQKRSVDEAGHGADDALDSIDAKRPRV